MARQTVFFSMRSRLLLVAIALFLALPALAMLWTDDAKRSRWENRALTVRPAVAGALTPGSGFPGRMDDWLEDHVGFALPMNRLYRELLFYGFRDSPSPQVTLGDDGFVFLNSHDARRPLSRFRELCEPKELGEDYRAGAADWLDLLRRFQRSGQRVALGIPPSKPLVYPEKLPASVPLALRQACLRRAGQPSAASRLTEDAARAGFTAVYPLDAFIAHRDEGNFYPRENFHFAGQSAHLFAEALLRAMGIEPNGAWQEHSFAQRTAADLAPVLGFRRYFVARGFPYSAFGISRAQHRPDFILACYPRASDFGTYEAQAPMTQRSALILSDSFGAFAAPHLAPAYRRLTWINVTALQPEDGAAFFGDCLQRIPVDDLFFVFHDATVLSRGATLHKLAGSAYLAPPHQ